MPQRLTKRILMAKLRKLLERARVEYRDLPVTQHAQSEWEEGGPIDITIDKSDGGDIPCTIHELLHVQLAEVLEPHFDNELEEAIIRGLEDYLMEKLKPRATKWWRAEIHRRIK